MPWLAVLLALAVGVAGCGPTVAPEPRVPVSAPLRAPDGPPLPPSQRGSPPPPDGPRSFRLVVISDTNSRYGSVELARRGIPEALSVIRGALRPHLVVHNGDQIAAGGRRRYPAEQVAAMWDTFHVTVTDVLRSGRIPLLPVPGNHDVLPAELAPIYERRWREPGVMPDLPWTDGARYPRRYALRFRDTELIILDAPTGRLSREERRWLRARLSAARDAALRIVFSHTPIAPLTRKDYGHLKPQDEVYGILMEGRTSLLVTSHDEVYFRGWYRELPVLATGGLGSTCRNLRGVEGCQGMSFPVIDVDEGRIARIFALTGRHFEQVYDEDTLPASVGEHYHR